MAVYLNTFNIDYKIFVNLVLIVSTHNSSIILINNFYILLCIPSGKTHFLVCQLDGKTLAYTIRTNNIIYLLQKNIFPFYKL